MEPIWITRTALLAIQRQLVTAQCASGDIRDEKVLEFSLVHPQNQYLLEGTDLFTLAAAYAFGIAKNHPFVDGNKRTAFMAAYVFLARNGWEFRAPEADVVVSMVALASSERSEEEFAQWLRALSRALH